MRRRSVSTMNNNFSYMYINLFQKRYLANRLARKTEKSCTDLLVTIINKDVEDIGMDGKEKLDKFSKKI